MVKNLVLTLLIAIFSLYLAAVVGNPIVLHGDQCIILDGNGNEETVAGKLTTVQTASKLKCQLFSHTWISNG
jgi:hypothetical protein